MLAFGEEGEYDHLTHKGPDTTLGQAMILGK
jgi:hypothetical protein